MDLLKELTERLKRLEGHPSFDGITAAAKHISIAERHYHAAVSNDDEEGFNDVIYRANQAFEGMLKEAHSIIVKGGSSKITPYEIEEYFSRNNVLKPRVMQLFTNYRKEWRNPSTHDHRAVFDEYEALMAISNVSSFAFILLGDILERENFSIGAKVAEEMPSQDKINIKERIDLSEIVAKSIISYSSKITDREFKELGPKFLEESLWGFLTTQLPDFSIDNARRIGDNKIYRPDLVIEGKGETAIVEVKISDSTQTIKQGYWQLVRYLHTLRESTGILYIQPTNHDIPLKTIRTLFRISDPPLDISIISPFSERTAVMEIGTNADKITVVTIR
ncbi:hypothetical protein [Deinococcus phoenicis]|uniref:hypothetical protein n=1 Tax=Deinococcus phoenicis TaxID=1476583 RepID=UPI001267D3ED|nr:hypothetical protein [Deinococcus phoenicis]